MSDGIDGDAATGEAAGPLREYIRIDTSNPPGNVRAVDEAVAELAEGARILPGLSSDFTDSHVYRLRGVPTFGFVPCLVEPAELGAIHAHNERISIENLRLGMQILHSVVMRLRAA